MSATNTDSPFLFEAYSGDWIKPASGPPADDQPLQAGLGDQGTIGGSLGKYMDLWVDATSKYIDVAQSAMSKTLDCYSKLLGSSPAGDAGVVGGSGAASEGPNADFFFRELEVINPDASGQLTTDGFTEDTVDPVIPPGCISFDPAVLVPGTPMVMMKVKASAIPTKPMNLAAFVRDADGKPVCDKVLLDTPLKKL